jgi:hypothetical protein
MMRVHSPVAKPARQFGHAMQIFPIRVDSPWKQSISKEMNNDNDMKFA